MKAAESLGNGAFYRKVDQAFYDEVKRQNGGILPPNLQDANGNPRKLTMSPADRAYRQKWKTIAARMRGTRAVPKKAVKSSCVPCAAKAAAAKIPPILLPSKKMGKPVKLGAPAQMQEAANANPPAREKKQTELPCKNATLTIACSHTKRNFKLQLPAPDAGEEGGVTQFEVIDDGKETITCTTKILAGPCGDIHKGKVFDIYPDDSVQSRSDSSLVFRANHDPSLKHCSFAELFSPSKVRTSQSFSIRTETCQEASPLSATVTVYPQVDWSVDFSFGYSASGSVGKSKAADPLSGDRTSQWKLDGDIGVTVVGTKIEYGQEIIQDLQQVLEVANLACDTAEFFSGVASALGGVEFNLTYPTFSFSGKWGWQEIEQSPACGYTLDLQVGAKPLIGASATVEIIEFALTKVPVLGQIIQWVRDLVKDEVQFQINLEVSGEVDGTFDFRQPLGAAADASGELAGTVKFKAESLVQAKQHGLSCPFFSVHWGFGAKLGAEGGFSGDIRTGHDGDGFYWQGEVKFDGLDFYAVAAGGVGFEFGPPPKEDAGQQYEVPDEDSDGEDTDVTVEGKIDSSGLEGNIAYQHVWHLFEERTIWGGEEKHPLFSGGSGA
jgi:hypothetical protein